MNRQDQLLAELGRIAEGLQRSADRLEAFSELLLVSTSHTASGSPEAGVPNSRLLTVPEVAAALNVGRSRVFALIRTGRLDSVKIGNSRRITSAALDRYLRRSAASAPQARQTSPLTRPRTL